MGKYDECFPIRGCLAKEILGINGAPRMGAEMLFVHCIWVCDGMCCR